MHLGNKNKTHKHRGKNKGGRGAIRAGRYIIGLVISAFLEILDIVIPSILNNR